jgi:hypothetical protein
MNWYKKAQKTNIGYKIVGWDGKRAYSIYDPKYTINLAKNEIISDSKGIYLGNTKEYCINYFGEGTNDQDMLLTYEYNIEDLVSGDPEFKNGEIVVKKARLINYELV